MPSDFIRKPVGKNEMIYDPDRDAVHILNPTAQLVVKLHREGLDETAIAQELQRRFKIEGENRVLDEVHACLMQLVSQNLL